MDRIPRHANPSERRETAQRSRLWGPMVTYSAAAPPTTLAGTRDTPASDLDTGLWVPQTISPDDLVSLAFVMGRSGGASPEDETAAVAIFGGEVCRHFGSDRDWLDWHYIGLLSLTCGAHAIVPSTPLAALAPDDGWALRHVDTITVTTDESLSPGIRVIHDVADGQAVAVLDMLGHPYLGLAMSLNGSSADGIIAGVRTV